MKMFKICAGNSSLALALAVVFLGLNGACGHKSGSDSQVASAEASDRYFKADLANFIEIQKTTSAPTANHPEYISAESDGTVLKVYSGGFASEKYILHADTGIIEREPNIDNTAPGINPPDRGGNYFRYVDYLSRVESILGQLNLDTGFVVAARNQIKALDIEVVGDMSYSSTKSGVGTAILGETLFVQLRYKAHKDRDLLIAVCDKSKCYSEERTALLDLEGAAKFEIITPEQLDLSSAYLSAKLTPKNADWQAKVSEQNITLHAEAYPRVLNYMSVVQKIGADQNAYVLYRSKTKVKFLIKLYDLNEKLLGQAESTKSYDAGEGNLNISYSISKDAEAKKNGGRGIIRMVDAETGDWDHYLASSTAEFDIVL